MALAARLRAKIDELSSREFENGEDEERCREVVRGISLALEPILTHIAETLNSYPDGTSQFSLGECSRARFEMWPTSEKRLKLITKLVYAETGINGVFAWKSGEYIANIHPKTWDKAPE